MSRLVGSGGRLYRVVRDRIVSGNPDMTITVKFTKARERSLMLPSFEQLDTTSEYTGTVIQWPGTTAAELRRKATWQSVIDELAFSGMTGVSVTVSMVTEGTEPETSPTSGEKPENKIKTEYTLSLKLADDAVLPKGRWCRLIKKKMVLSSTGTPLDDSPSAFTGMRVGSFFKPTTQLTLSHTGSGERLQYDEVLLVRLVAIASVKDVSMDSAKEKFDVTTQVDDYKTFVVSDTIEQTGSIEGVFDPEDALVKDMIQQFNPVLEVNANGSFSSSPIRSGVVECMLSRNDRVSGQKVTVWHFMPLTIDSLSAGKPMNDAQTISMNFSLNGAHFPHTIYING